MDPHSYHRHNYDYQFHKHDQVKPPTSPPRKVQNFRVIFRKTQNFYFPEGIFEPLEIQNLHKCYDTLEINILEHFEVDQTTIPWVFGF